MPDPVISFGGGSGGSGSGATPPAAPSTPAPPASTPSGDKGAPAPPAIPSTPSTESTESQPEKPDSFSFKFDGDDETYSFEPEKTDDTEVKEQYDASKPFDPAAEEALKDHPEILKTLKQGHYELRQLKSELQKAGFKTAKEVKAFKDRIEALGGTEKIEAESKEWSERYSQFQNGDPAIIDAWTKENPEGMVKLSGPMLDWLYRTNPGVWASRMGKVFMATLTAPNAQGMSALAAFNALYDIEGIKGNAPAEKLLGQIADKINSVNDAVKKGDAAPTNGEGKERQEFATQKHGLFLKEVNGLHAAPTINAAVTQAMKVAFKGINITDKEVIGRVRANIMREFNEMQKKDPTFQQNAKDLLRKEDIPGFVRVLKSAIARNMPRAALREARMFKGLTGNNAQRKAEGQARTEAGGGGAGQGNRMRYTGPMRQGGPDPAQIDYQAMRAKWGRAGTDERLGNHEFLKKGADSNVIYFW